MLSQADRARLVELEEGLWRDETRFDRRHMERVLAPDFFEFGRSGKTCTREQTLAVPRQVIAAVLPLRRLAIRVLDADTAQLTYDSAVVHEGQVEHGRRSSIWSRHDGDWVLRFHQGTPAGAVSLGPVDHRDPAVARQIHGVLMLAYAQEATLLELKHFSPLGRTVDDIRGEPDCYLGAFEHGALVGALGFAPDEEPGQFSVNSLVVHPDHQRRGIGRSLLLEALRLGDGEAFAVSTAAKNAPALALYTSHGFVAYRFGTIGPEALALVKLRRPAGQPSHAPPASHNLPRA